MNFSLVEWIKCRCNFFFSILRSRKCGIIYTRFSYISRSHKCGIILTRLHTFISWRKTGMLKFFVVLVVCDIGADNTSQILPVKIYSSQSRASEANSIGFGYNSFLLVLFDWYYPLLHNYFHRYRHYHSKI